MEEYWNVKKELDKADYSIEKERNKHGCPYCGYLNRKHQFKVKGFYCKCENCMKVFRICR
jgi:Zn finger protein HypA/HybF involved in hydrogenase expression